MTGKDFETLCKIDLDYHHKDGSLHAGKYGVKGSFHQNKWQPIKSLPDFEGVLFGGRQFIFDAKVCSQASFDLARFRRGADKSKAQQLDHMLKRADYGVICFFLIHFPTRELKTRTDEQMTVAFPVHRDHDFWQDFLRCETTSLTRIHCQEYGVAVEWHTPGRTKTERPDILSAVRELEESVWFTTGVSV